ncbi:hypothetical protein [Flavobacterium panici]|uniref:Uncharacterized protein n=1 Tax=Flavobacterium panici TaxID=2654843 RepID=A0A9N8IYI3_9FLAO|nr:hypothetical protein [Flavobacterium panici]CAC9972770.1 hypothetical protein FLAPXU55_00449 [Flavobacterium panici]
MKSLQQKKIKKSEVLKVMLVFVFAVFFISCNNDSSEDQNAESSKTEQQNQLTSRRIYDDIGILVRNWGSHNVDCSQPGGFCSHVYTIGWHGFLIPNTDGTPVRVTNEKGNFVMEIQKSALTEEHQKELLRNGEFYVIPEGQIIQPELVKPLKFNSDILVPGKYPIQESEETYTISINVK